MGTYTIEATITSPPTRVGGTINKTTVLKMHRDEDENWSGSAKNVTLPDSFDAVVAAVGVTSVPFSVEIKVTDAEGNQTADLKKDLTLSASGILIVHLPIQLKTA
jgi:hypothetical protein